MNIFINDKDPILSANNLFREYVNKLPTESVQLLSAACRMLVKKELADKLNPLVNKLSHLNHPSAIWIRESRENFEWLLQHTETLFNRVYVNAGVNKADKVFSNIKIIYKQNWLSFPTDKLTLPLLAMKEPDFLDIKEKHGTKVITIPREKKSLVAYRANSWLDCELAYKEYIRRKVFLPNTKEGKEKGYLRLPTWFPDQPIPNWYNVSCGLVYRGIYNAECSIYSST